MKILKFILKAIILLLVILLAFLYGRRVGQIQAKKECSDTCVINLQSQEDEDTTSASVKALDTESRAETDAAVVCPPSVVVEPLNVNPEQDVVLVVPKDALTVVDSDNVIITKKIIEEKVTVPAKKTTKPKKKAKKTAKKPAATQPKAEPAPAKTVEPLEPAEEVMFCFDPNEDKEAAAKRIAALIKNSQIITKRHGYMIYLHIPEGTSENPVVQERVALISQALQEAGFAKWRIRTRESGKVGSVSSAQTTNDLGSSVNCIVMTAEQ